MRLALVSGETPHEEDVTACASEAARRVVEHCLLPSLSLLPPNPGVVMEAWACIKALPHTERHALYASWRGRGVERAAIGTKHFALAVAECAAGYAVRSALKRVANEKKNAKHVGRALAKIAHSNPVVLFHIVLSSIQSYDNMIAPIVESLSLWRRRLF